MLAGLELLLPLIVDDAVLDAAAVAAAFPLGRPREGGAGGVPVTTTEFVADHVLAATSDWMGQTGRVMMMMMMVVVMMMMMVMHDDE